MKESTDKKSYWWQIERREHGEIHDVANSVNTAVSVTAQAATQNAREIKGVPPTYMPLYVGCNQIEILDYHFRA